MKYGGVVVPIVTPFTPKGDIDEPAVERITEHLVSHHHAGVFPLGTTGESSSIPYHSKRKVVGAAVKANRGRSLVYAGIASNSFRESVDAAKLYKELGADCAVAQPLNAQQRGRGSPLEERERGEPGQAGEPERERAGRRPSVRGGLRERVDERGQARRRDGGAAKVQTAPPRRLRVGRHDGGPAKHVGGHRQASKG